MRVDVVKLLFVGVEAESSLFFKKAQEKGIIEFIPSKGGKVNVFDQDSQKFISAIKVLRGLQTVDQLEDVNEGMALTVASRILEEHSKLIKLQDEEKLLQLEIARVDFFGDFSLEDIAFIENRSHRKLRYFYRILSQDNQNPEPLDDDLIYLGEENGIQYFISLDGEVKNFEDVIELKIEHPVSQLQKRLHLVKDEIRHVEKELKQLAQYNRFLHHALVHRMNIVNLEMANECRSNPIEGRLFAVEGWVPKTQIAAVIEFCSSLNVYAEEVAIEPPDHIPTYLENKKWSKIGEDLVNIYDTPSITDYDPSPWVLWAFVLFFAMIINDAGYGLLFLLGSLFIYFRFPKLEGVQRRVVKLAILLSTACVLWGTLTTSFFGINVSFDNPIRKISFVDWLVEKKAEYHIHHKDVAYQELIHEYPQLSSVNNPSEFINLPKSLDHQEINPIRDNFSGTIMFEIALMVGTVHMILSILRNLRRSWAGVGWIIFMIGGYLYFPTMLHATSIIHFAFDLPKELGGEIGIQMIYIGIGLALVLALIQKRLGGSLEFMVLIQIFCDVLSYLRLYALGLAGMMMGTTFNEMAAGAGIVFGTIIVLCGHTINIAIGIMGGVIHGLRLNFLEWYHYSFEGGGKSFKPLKLYKK